MINGVLVESNGLEGLNNFLSAIPGKPELAFKFIGPSLWHRLKNPTKLINFCFHLNQVFFKQEIVIYYSSQCIKSLATFFSISLNLLCDYELISVSLLSLNFLDKLDDFGLHFLDVFFREESI